MSRPTAMTGSYAGAMGQPQFMPSSYLRYAVDFEGHGRRDIWTSKPDVLGSIANYLAQSGWRDGQTWGQEVMCHPGWTPRVAMPKRPLADWARAGVRPLERALDGVARYPGGHRRAGRSRRAKASRCSAISPPSGGTIPRTTMPSRLA